MSDKFDPAAEIKALKATEKHVEKDKSDDDYYCWPGEDWQKPVKVDYESPAADRTRVTKELLRKSREDMLHYNPDYSEDVSAPYSCPGCLFVVLALLVLDAIVNYILMT